MSETRDKTIHIRVTESEKEKMNKIAESVSMDLSALIRNAVLTDEKLVLLPDGSVIAKGISELINKFQGASRSGVIDKKYCAVLLTSLEELVCAFNQLMNPFKDILVEDIDDEEFYDYLDGRKPKNKGENFIMNNNSSSVNNKNTFETAPAANTTHWIAPQPVQSYPPQYIPQYAAQPVPLYMTQTAPQYLPQIPPQYSMQLAQQYPMLPESQYTQQSAYQYIFQPTPQYSPQPEYQYTPQPGQPAQTPPVAFPTMMLNFSSRITINATQSTTIQEIKDYLNAVTPKVSSSNLFKYAVAMASELERRNIQMNIEANLFPDITINMTGADDDSDENKVIDVEQD